MLILALVDTAQHISEILQCTVRPFELTVVVCSEHGFEGFGARMCAV